MNALERYDMIRKLHCDGDGRVREHEEVIAAILALARTIEDASTKLQPTPEYLWECYWASIGAQPPPYPGVQTPREAT